MTRPVIICRPDDTVEHALEELWHSRIRRLAVVEERYLVDELSMKEIIAAYYITACSIHDGS